MLLVKPWSRLHPFWPKDAGQPVWATVAYRDGDCSGWSVGEIPGYAIAPRAVEAAKRAWCETHRGRWHFETRPVAD